MVQKILRFLFLCESLLLIAGCATTNYDVAKPLAEGIPGERIDVSIPVPAATDPETFIPITVLRGSSTGPTVLMVAGVHGYEFAPILAAQRLADEIMPADSTGTLILVRGKSGATGLLKKVSPSAR